MPTPRTGLHARPATDLRTVTTTGPDDTFVMAVDLGTGGPKVAVLSASGRIVAHAFRPVGLDLTEDGGAEQSPARLVGGRRGLDPRGTGRQRGGAPAGRRDRLHLAVVRHRAGRRRGRRHRSRHHLDGLARGTVGPRHRARRAQRAGLLGLQVGPLGPAHGRHPQPLGQGPGRPHPLPAQRAARRLPRRGGLPRAGGLPEPASHRTGPRLSRLHHGALGHRQPRRPRRGLRRPAGRAGRSRALTRCPSWCPRAASSAGSPPTRPPSSACSPAPRWWRERATCTRPRWARARCPTSTGTSTSAHRVGSAATSPSRRPMR